MSLETPTRKARKGGDIRPSAVSVAEALTDLAVDRIVNDTNESIAIAAGHSVYQHQSANVSRALRVMRLYEFIAVSYDPLHRARTITILVDDLPAKVRSLL
jgi:hypothetical protein